MEGDEGAVKIEVTRKSDGAVRIYNHPGEWGGSDFYWREGNGSCDCNRALYFGWAAGEDMTDDETPCGQRLFGVRVMSEDGKVLYEEEP